jgi:GTP-binding protein LepA
MNRWLRSYSAKSIEFPPELIRNFSIIAHIDHGKSTLADRILELTGVIAKGGNSQVLDKLKVERDRGITVKAQTATMFHTVNSRTYLINLIDTPGHVDFSYEVSRSLAACQGCAFLVDATKGVQAQTVANFYLAFAQDLTIIPVLNKIDLPSADQDKVKEQLENAFEIPSSQVLGVSAKTGLGVSELLDRLVLDIPPPTGDVLKPFKCLLFDTWYETYKGVICLVAVKEGKVKKGDRIISNYNQQIYEVHDLGIMHPDPVTTLELGYAFISKLLEQDK